MAIRVITLHTHYDNLKVSRDASPAAINAAYQAMVRRFGPGRRPGDARAAQKMAIIDASYAVLSNPHQRALHDLWVAQNDYPETLPPPPASTIPPLWMHSEAPQHYHQSARAPLPLPLESTLRTTSRAPSHRSVLPRPAGAAARDHLRSNWTLYAVGAVVALLALVTAAPRSLLDDGPSLSANGPLRGFSVPVLFAPPAYTRPATAPNGQPWPASAGYVDGYPLLDTHGTGRITVDNSRNGSDAFVKLVAQRDGQAQVVRHLYVPAHQSFTVEQLAPGSYDLRYRNLASGALERTPGVSVGAAQAHSQPVDASPPIRVALHREPQGHRPALPLAEKEFF